MPWVYILRCADASLYVGLTDDLEARERAHREGRGCSYTRRRTPVSLAYVEFFADEGEARDRERQLKRWSGKKKEALIAGRLETLKELSRRRT